MDVAEFAVIRAPRAPRFGPTVPLPGKRTVTIRVPGPLSHVPPPVTLDLDPNHLPTALGPIPENPPAGSPGPDATILERILALIADIEYALALAGDRITGEDLDTLFTHRLEHHHLDTEDWSTLFDTADLTRQVIPALALVALRERLVPAMTGTEPDYDTAVRLTRLVLVAALLAALFERDDLTTDDTFDLLHRTPVVIPEMAAEDMTGTPRIQLLREARVSDLQVLRREWVGYLPGEVANVRNVMAGESFGMHELTVRETETTTENVSENRETTESSTESRLQTELTSEVNSQLGITVNGHVEASAEFKYPVVTARVGGGIDAGLSLQRSERQASRIAREAVARAMSRVESMTRDTRTRRELSRSEQGMNYALRNPGPQHLHAIYRWVDRVDGYQLFRYVDRLLLEFQLPEPAEFHRWRTGRAKSTAAAVDAPPAWALTAAEITPAGLIALAARYRATSLPPPPDDEITVIRTVTAEVGQEQLPADAQKPWNPPTATREVDIPIPDDYAATAVRYAGESYPIAGQWKNSAGNEQTGTRTGFVTVAVGAEARVYWNGGITRDGETLTFYATHGDNTDIGSVDELQFLDPPYGRAFVPITGQAGLDPVPVTVDLDDFGPVPNLLRVAVSTLGVLSSTVTFQVRCGLTGTARSAWQLGVYDALFSAWSQWKRDYEAAQIRDAFMGGQDAADAGSSQRNEQIIREELKRQVIAWLLDDEAFDGRPALHPRPADGFADPDIGRAITDAPTIQFLEQAFEWSNLSWVFYPYYWADRTKWEELSQVTANDPEFERFLRAGSSRIVLPARPGFDDAVHNWLKHGVPFVDGQLPSPGDDLYVSIDKEVREITSPVPGGIPGDYWQARLSTTMLYLEDAGDLPLVNADHQLPAPVGVPYIPDIIIDPSAPTTEG